MLLGTIMAAGTVLTGCGGSKESSTEAEGTSAGQVSENLNVEGLPILKEKETFTIAVKQGSTLKEAAEKQCVIDTENATNVHIEWMEIPESGWEEKINIMFSTDTLPDAIIGGLNLAQYGEQCLALDDYLPTYAPNMTAYFETSDVYPEALRAPDGKIRTLPCGDETIPNMIDSQLWINTEWLDKLGLEMPTTTDEFKEVLTAFRDQDPNGNGKKDEIPFTFLKAWGWGNSIENFFGPWGVVENDKHIFTNKENQVVFSAREQGYYDALTYLHDLYAEGLIDKEAFVMGQDQYDSRGASGDVIGVMAGYNNQQCAVENGSVEDPRYMPLPLLKGPDGTQMVLVNGHDNMNNFTITHSCKNPEALVRWYDYVNSSLELAGQWGRGKQGVSWDVTEVNGEKAPLMLTMTPEVLEANGGYKTWRDYRQAESFAGSTPALWRVEYDQNAQYDTEYPSGWEKKQSVLEQMEYGVSILPPGTASQGNSERRAFLLVDIDNYLTQFVADSVINGIDETKWNTHLQTLESLKVDEYVQLCQEFVDQHNNK